MQNVALIPNYFSSGDEEDNVASANPYKKYYSISMPNSAYVPQDVAQARRYYRPRDARKDGFISGDEMQPFYRGGLVYNNQYSLH